MSIHELRVLLGMSTIYSAVAVDRSMANVLLREEPEDEEEEDERKDDEEEEDDENEEDGDGYSVNAVSGSDQTDFEGRRNSITLPL